MPLALLLTERSTMYPTKLGGSDDFEALGEGKSDDATSNHPGEPAEFPGINPRSNATAGETGQSQSFPRPRQPQYYQYPPNPNNPNFPSNANNMQLQIPGHFIRPEQFTMDPSFSSRPDGGHDYSRMGATPFSGYRDRTPGGFDTVGRTPLTAASLGSSQGQPTPPVMNPQLFAGTGNDAGNVTMPMGSNAAGLVRGDDPLFPTPVVRRKESERLRQQQQRNPDRSPGIHYHAPVAQSSSNKHPSSRSQATDSPAIQRQEEEDPSIIRYESRHGADQSPLVARDTMQPAAGITQRSNLSTIDDPSPSSSNRAPGQSAMDASTEESYQQQLEQPPTLSTSLREFPFYFDGYGGWVCRHCTHVPPYYRGVNYLWQFPHAPPNHFVDQHLAFCQGLNPPSSQPPPPPPAEGSSGYPSQYLNMPQPPLPPPLQGGYRYPMQQHPPYMGQQEQHQHQQNPPHSQLITRQESRQSSQSSAEPRSLPDPPGVTTPKSLGTGSESLVAVGQGQRLTSSDHPGETHFFPRHPYQQPPQYPYPSYHPPPPLRNTTSMMPPPGPPTILHSPRSTLTRPPRPGNVTSASPALKKKPGVKTSPSGRNTDDMTYTKSIQFLKKKSDARPEPTESDIGATLIEDSDCDLLTDYFFYMMKQLVVCRFSEKDRKTRGGKRESINLGYGGLQCLHCFDNPGSRKFYWSNVDRLANSFAEIPGHVLKCKSCPDDIKDALLVLKGRHADQMQLLPRGSQKVFFRRMWRRLHDGDAEAGATANTEGAVSTSSKESSSTTNRGIALSGESEPSLKSSIVDSDTAARILKESKSKTPSTPSQLKSERILLAIPEDKEWLSDMDCFVRQNIEVFSATTRDVAVAEADRKYPIKPYQVGIRCIHCALTAEGARGTAVSYPYSISGIYESVREFQRMHLENCSNLPADMRAHSQKLGGASSLSSVLRRYYVQSARALGLFDTAQGIQAGADPVPMSPAGFQSPTATFRNLSLPSPQISDSAQRKRKAPEDEDDGKPEAKRQDMDS